MGPIGIQSRYSKSKLSDQLEVAVRVKGGKIEVRVSNMAEKIAKVPIREAGNTHL